MAEVDQRQRLAETVFTYRVSKAGKILIFWQGKQIMVLKEAKAQKLLLQLADADDHQTQLALAKVTGNFKRGNER